MRFFLWASIVLAAGAMNAFAQTAKPVNYHNPSWSPDGKQIVFESDRDGKFAVYTINTDGSHLTKLTNGAANDEQPRWSKDGRKIVFISDRDGAFHIYLMQRNGSAQIRVSNSSRAEFIPDLSPNGKQVVFVSGESSYLISIKSKKETILPSGGEHLRWSPNGRSILFSKTEPIPKSVMANPPKTPPSSLLPSLATRDNSTEIFVMNHDGSGVRKLTDNTVKDDSGEWSRDGKQIYFVSSRDGSPNLFVMNANGSNVKQVANGPFSTDLSVSQDGKFLVHSKQKDGKQGIVIYDITTRSERLLID